MRSSRRGTGSLSAQAPNAVENITNGYEHDGKWRIQQVEENTKKLTEVNKKKQK